MLVVGRYFSMVVGENSDNGIPLVGVFTNEFNSAVNISPVEQTFLSVPKIPACSN